MSKTSDIDSVFLGHHACGDEIRLLMTDNQGTRMCMGCGEAGPTAILITEEMAGAFLTPPPELEDSYGHDDLTAVEIQ